MTPPSLSPRRFLVTVDDPGGLIQDLAVYDRVRRFFDAEGVPATFMVVPRGEGDWQLDRQDDWLAALREAERDGHDSQMHGLDHNNCEFGPYPDLIVALGKDDTAARQRAYAEQFGHLWNRDVHVEKLTTAIGIFERALERRPLVLRTGALSQTPELYDAVADVGMHYVSNHITDPRGWTYIIEEYDNPGDWDPSVPPGPYHLTDRVIDLPIISEYAWYLTEEKIARHLALAADDLRRVYEAGDVFVLVCHVQCVGAEDGLSQKLLHQLLELTRSEYQPQFQTFRELVADIEAGAVGVLPRPVLP
jgi:peptidoglycan/xylan/chitin deacetylase (PgdA/CDA1 family)